MASFVKPTPSIASANLPRSIAYAFNTPFSLPLPILSRMSDDNGKPKAQVSFPSSMERSRPGAENVTILLR
jgi:hypothetical protein